MADKEEIRGYIPADLRRVMRAVIALRMDKDLSVGDVLEEAIGYWLDKPENKELIDRHRLRDTSDEDTSK